MKQTLQSPGVTPVSAVRALHALVRKAQLFSSLSSQDIRAIILAIYAGQLFDQAQFGLVRSILQGVKPVEPVARELLRDFLSLDYQWYRHRKLTERLELPPDESYSQPDYRVDSIPTSTAHNRRPATAMVGKYLTIHSTGNPKSTAKGERSWLTNAANDRAASFHVVVDESEAIECIPLNEIAWHAGDGSGSSSGNKTSISLEICESGDRTKTLRNAIAIAAKILNDKNLNVASLRRHYDWSQKDCPRILINASLRAEDFQTWDWFKEEVGKLV